MGTLLNISDQSRPASEDAALSSDKFLQRLEAIHELPTLSSVALQLGRMLEDVNIAAQDVAQIIENDQSIVTKMLRLVNSAFFGFSKKVSSVRHALMLLGFNTVRNAIISIDVINALSLEKQIQGFDITAYWQHSIGVAIISRYLDQKTGSNYHENVFTAGIIHDIGKIVMARYFTEQFRATWKIMQAESLRFSDAEKRYFPVDHAKIGSQLAQKWHLPELMYNVVGKHHTDTKNELEPLIFIIHTADALSHAYLENTATTAINEWPICKGARHLLRPWIKSADKWVPELRQEIDEACTILLAT